MPLCQAKIRGGDEQWWGSSSVLLTVDSNWWDITLIWEHDWQGISKDLLRKKGHSCHLLAWVNVVEMWKSHLYSDPGRESGILSAVLEPQFATKVPPDELYQRVYGLSISKISVTRQ